MSAPQACHGRTASTASAPQWPSRPCRSAHRRVRRVLTLGLVASAAAAAAASSFVPPATGSVASAARADRSTRFANSGSSESEYAPYDWQRVGSSPPRPGNSEAPVRISDLPDLPDFSDDNDFEVSSLGAQVKSREVGFPDLPGDPELLPPGPNPVTEGGLGLLEWTGIWIGGLLLLTALAGAGSYALARVQMSPELAESALAACKVGFTVFQVLFGARVLLGQFPKIDTKELPWAIFHYPTEWVLAPTRAIFKPEAGVDISPILWLMILLLAAELLTGPAGILVLTKDARASLPAGLDLAAIRG
ncbi:unnamed protein product [Polarella glacialis]|uniref:Uncharacterized protein n=1 Tax=Polarella glacialis TaxID=89957 RepID=A0A813GRD5_POLGL|nr:unnamed protein product [Polarella glacialis]